MAKLSILFVVFLMVGFSTEISGRKHEEPILPEQYVSTEDNVSPSNDLTDAESFEAVQDQEQASVLEKRRKKRAPTLYPPPTSFDYRLNSSCQSLADIRQQLCGDCW
uniref:Uncharacterized protein n=1 Tax=Romanomermis culicivorax TaxID=13658 RepID=A0A915IPW1_ROMCU